MADIPEDVMKTARERAFLMPIVDSIIEACALNIAHTILAERERCAQIAESNNSWPQEGAEIADEIRRADVPQD